MLTSMIIGPHQFVFSNRDITLSIIIDNAIFIPCYHATSSCHRPSLYPLEASGGYFGSVFAMLPSCIERFLTLKLSEVNYTG